MSSNISLFITTSVVLLKERKTQRHLTRPATFNSSSPTVDLPHERQSRSQNPALLNPEFSLRNPESPLTIGVRNPSSTGKESEIRHLESGIRNQEFSAWSPESKTVLDYLSWSESMKQKFKIDGVASTFKSV